MMNRNRFITLLLLIAIMAGCTVTSQESEKTNDEARNESEQNASEQKDMNLIGKVSLSQNSGRIGDEVTLTVESLKPDTPLKVVWVDMIGYKTMR